MAESSDAVTNREATDRLDGVGSDSDGPEENRRRSARFACAGEAKISRLPSDGFFLPAKILDLSLHGCRVDTTLPIDYGVRAEIVLRVNATSIRAVGEVRAMRGDSGAGIEFVHLSSGGKDMLADLIKELARLQAAMNKLTSARLATNARSFRTQLEDGKLQAARLSRRIAVLGVALSDRNLAESSESNRTASAGKNAIEEVRPLVIAVDLFG
jgi:hypothetical protein